ncbi:MAG: TlpA family protein disulfide reductase, partial [Bacteroidetes bacterium]|nr:TlpA family protein disulfide reductase [Fibrella sp.]
EHSQEASISINEVVVVDNHVFKVISCNMDGSVLRLAYEGYQKNREGGMLDNKIPVLTGKSLTNDDTISINKLVSAGNYVLLDFWGSWCAPCIRSMPNLKLLADRVEAGKVKLVGVDYEYSSNGQQSAKEYLTKNKINWRQVAELSTAQTDKSFPTRMSVKNYPTFILINPDGKIIAREIGEDGLLRIESQLNKLGLLNKL